MVNEVVHSFIIHHPQKSHTHVTVYIGRLGEILHRGVIKVKNSLISLRIFSHSLKKIPVDWSFIILVLNLGLFTN